MEIVGGIVRAVLGALSGGLIADGVATADQINSISGALVLIVTIGWSIYQKKKAK